MKVLVVEDDPKVARFVVRVLTEEGFTVDLCRTGVDGVQQARTGLYDLMVLDWMLPDIDGLAVCRDVRVAGVIAPILMLTARGETKERVIGLESGADDYMVKPFEVEEFVARVRALLRRSAGFARIRCGDLEVDRVGHHATLSGEAMNLTSREYALLVYLLQKADNVVTRSELLAHVWETTFDPGSNLVEVHVSRLREKLGKHAWMIETVRGAGYRLRSVHPTPPS